jgi:LEA14-like dessication related protein
MKKVLLFGGIAIAGFGLYRYFKYQIDLALNYDYKLKNFEIVSQDGDIMTVSATFELVNKSSFKVEVNGYDLELFFKEVPFANTKSDNKVTIEPNSSFEIVGTGEINLAKSKILLLPFIKDIAERKPIDVSVSGIVNVVFLGIPTSLKFDKQKFNYSVDLISDYKLGGAYDRLRAKYPKVFDLLGIKPKK